jgi:serine/threonine-protein kinase HipA
VGGGSRKSNARRNGPSVPNRTFPRPTGDFNPVPVDIKPRILTTAINEDDGTASLDLAMSIAEYFELGMEGAKVIAARVGKAVSTWRDDGARHGIENTEMDRVASAFEHNHLKQAVGR